MRLLSLRVYGGRRRIRAELEARNISFTERDFLSDFWGTEFEVEKPSGKGATKKLSDLYAMGFIPSRNKVGGKR
jgi:hypothetical protein